MGIEIDGVIIPFQPVIPPGFDVWDFHCITDRLNMAGGGARLGTKEGRHAGAEEVADCRREGEGRKKRRS